MSTPPPPSPNINPSTEMQSIWSCFRAWDARAVELKSNITGWRRGVLILSIAGTVAATLSQQLSGVMAKTLPSFPKGLGFGGAIALGLAGYFTREVLKPSKQSEQVRARSAAEGFKTEAYLLATNAPPYNTVTGSARLEKADKISAAVADLRTPSLSDAVALTDVLAENMTVDDYIQQRVDDQVVGFYLRRVNEYSKKVKQGEAFSLVFGALALVLGVISATAKFGWTAGWVAVIGTSVAAVVAYQSAARYQFLVVTYEATANRLKKLKRDWQLLRKTDTDRPERDEFILKCEEAISIENSAWMAEWTKSAKS